eukprot:TRINITY_DN7156_c0_g1_i2.p1 TRINITY_DN7156_c0_g1~~TRINITY_DN7156_c0_g1_i2.p1  ORF type:complete len:833 (-),score=250.28 TRINITY_DN7156_c0_g1_i2:7-2190(-)
MLINSHFEKLVSSYSVTEKLSNEMRVLLRPKKGDTSFLDVVEKSVSVVQERANQEFMGMISKKHTTDLMRLTLSFVHRYLFLMHLPKTIDENIRHLEFDKAVQNYGRSKVFSSVTNPSLLTVLKKVETKMEEFRNDMFKRLDDPLFSLAEQEKIIFYLLDAGSTRHPALVFLENKKNHIIHLFDGCISEYQSRVQASKKRMEQEQETSRKIRQMQAESVHQQEPAASKEGVAQQKETATHTAHTLQIPYLLHSLVEVLQNSIGEVFSLSSNILAGKYDRNFQEESGGEKETEKERESLLREKTEDTPQMKKKRRLKALEEKVFSVQAEIFSTFSRKFGSAFFEREYQPRVSQSEDIEDDRKEDPNGDSVSKDLQKHWRTGILDLMRCFSTVDFQSSKAASCLFNLLDDMRAFFVRERFAILFRDTMLLDTQVEDEDEDMPIQRKFEFLALATLQDLADIIPEDDELVAIVRIKIMESLRVCLDAFHSLSFLENSPSEDQENKRDNGEDLLRVLDSLHQSRHTVFPRIFDVFRGNFTLLGSSKSKLDKIYELCADLDQLILDKFVCMQSSDVTATIRHAILLSGVDYTTKTAPTTVSDYVGESLLLILFVHEKVVQIAPHHLSSVINRLAEAAAQAIMDSTILIDTFTPAAAAQIEADVLAFEALLPNFVTSRSKSTREQVVVYLTQQLRQHGGTRLEDAVCAGLVSQFVAGNRGLFRCFQTDAPDQK